MSTTEELKADDLIGPIIETVLLKEVFGKQDVIYVPAGVSLREGMNKLFELNISSLPVFLTGKKAEKMKRKQSRESASRMNLGTIKGKPARSNTDVNGSSNHSLHLTDCLGILDFNEIMQHLLRVVDSGAKNVWQIFEKTPVEKAIKLNVAKLLQISEDSALELALKRTAEFGLRRQLAVDEEHNVTALISPSEFVKYICDAVGESTDDTMRRTLGELFVGSEMLKCSKNDSLRTAVDLMLEAHISAIGIIDEKEVLIGSLSMSDFHLLLAKQKEEWLHEPVWKFVQKAKEQEDNERAPVFAVTMETSLRSTIARMEATQVHHLYIVDNEYKPLKKLGFSDICRGMLQYKRLHQK